MTLPVQLPDELGRRLAAAAAARGMTPDELAVEAVEAVLAEQAKLGFIGIGRSGRGDVSERYKEIRREMLAERRARDV